MIAGPAHYHHLYFFLSQNQHIYFLYVNTDKSEPVFKLHGQV